MKPNKIKIHLQYPWKFPDSPYYKYLIDSTPEGVEFQNTKREKGVITKSSNFKFSQKLKNFIKDTPQKFGITIVNSHKSPKGNYNLIHCAHCLSKNKDKSWVADLEMGGSLLISGFKNKNWQKEVRKYLHRKNCKKIMPWTNFVKKRILEDFPEIENKLEVVYPAVPIRELKKTPHEKITLIYFARAFQFKGGVLALEVMKRLKEKYDVRCIVISSVPDKLKEFYKEIEIYNLLPQKKVFELMEESDIFLYPSQMDTFGFGILEAMSFGLPVVALNTPGTDSIEEMIEDGKHGYLIDYSNPRGYLKNLTKDDEEILSKLYESCEKIITNKSLREKMSRAGRQEIESGKFSTKVRNESLRKIYEEALRN